MTSPAAAEIVRGTMRLLLDLELASLPEFTLASGRRLDVMAVGRDGRLVAVEVKSCRADYLTAWWNVIDWYTVSTSFETATTSPRT